MTPPIDTAPARRIAVTPETDVQDAPFSEAERTHLAFLRWLIEHERLDVMGAAGEHVLLDDVAERPMPLLFTVRKR